MEVGVAATAGLPSDARDTIIFVDMPPNVQRRAWRSLSGINCCSEGASPMTKSDERKAGFFALMARYNVPGCLLHAADEIDPGDIAAMVESRLIIAEMNRTKSEMDALLERPT
jgi:hypothetical protein